MPTADQIDEDAYAIAKAFAEKAHCSIAGAVSEPAKHVETATNVPAGLVKSGGVRFPLVHGGKQFSADDVAKLEDKI